MMERRFESITPTGQPADRAPAKFSILASHFLVVFIECDRYEVVNISYTVITRDAWKAVIRVSIYLALGDSITAGYGVGSLFSFPTLYGNYLRRHNQGLSVHNLGVNGLTTLGLLELLQFNRSLRHLVTRASLITITIGSNDLLHHLRNSNQAINTFQFPMLLGNMGKSLDQAGEVVRRLNPKAIVKVATLYNPMPADLYAQYNEQVQGVIDAANALVIAWAKRYGFVVVNLVREIRGQERYLIGPDYGHPNAAGYRAIAKAFARY
jgi:lysophospholipase L1-like esterase